jgi:hypothetical protein
VKSSKEPAPKRTRSSSDQNLAHDERGQKGGAYARSMSITEGNGSAAPQVTQRTAHDERGQNGGANAWRERERVVTDQAYHLAGPPEVRWGGSKGDTGVRVW